jgi:hypothetical protein
VFNLLSPLGKAEARTLLTVVFSQMRFKQAKEEELALRLHRLGIIHCLLVEVALFMWAIAEAFSFLTEAWDH